MLIVMNAAFLIGGRCHNNRYNARGGYVSDRGDIAPSNSRCFAVDLPANVLTVRLNLLQVLKVCQCSDCWAFCMVGLVVGMRDWACVA